ncbi:sperm-tail PG-rich repeat-containing protein 2 [Odontesthes bonariensis]|uniref:sperm-tail PG-rich repeat-containing protein 2 n=1 Tax=Odontesthes bonariensis TaxID=219752 RepID=UPI003F582D4D
MYVRSPRVIFEAKGGTPSTVGPGSYDVCPSNYIISDGYAPFQSLTNRTSIFSNSSERSPGPGQYDPSPINGNISGGHSLQNRSKRFEEVRSEGPGPGAYNVLPLSRNARSAMKANVGQPEGLGRIMLPAKSLQLVHRTHTPSIPSPGQAFGYEENEEGVLCKRQPPPRDTTLGPGYYHSPLDEMNFPKYKGAHFGNMTGMRNDMKKEAGPGPGQYFPQIIPKTHYVNVRRKLVIPRYHELVPQQVDKKGIPGPGQYDIRGQFEKPVESSSSLPRLKWRFLSKTERFSDVIEVSPPVGSYDEPRCALELLKRTTGAKKSPFGSTAVRFPCDHRKSSIPGPGSYDVFELGLANESLKRAISGQTRKGGFGSTARRSSIFYKKDSEETPGPGQYEMEKNEEPSYKKQLTAVFKSATERLASSPLTKGDLELNLQPFSHLDQYRDLSRPAYVPKSCCDTSGILMCVRALGGLRDKEGETESERDSQTVL